ncbi:MAG: ABC transporter substrate-binding protein [Gallionellaceae bacterium]
MYRALTIAILLAALSACQKTSSQSAESKLPTQKITVTYTFQPQSTLVHVAMAKGYFAEQGLDVKPVMRTFGKASLQTVLDHESDFATVAETPVMFNILKGEKIFLIANIEQSTTNNAIVARKDAGIKVAADLKGKRIGYTPGTTSEFFLDSLLTANGLLRKEIRPVPVKPENMLDAIMSKKVDAASTWNYPLTLIKRKLGTNGILFYDNEIYTETFNIAAQQDFVQQHPETVQKFLRALIKAEDFVTNNTDAAQSIMSEATKIDKDLIKEVWGSFNYHVVLDQTLLLTLEDETRWAIKNKLTKQTKMPDYMDFIHLDSLKAVKPEAIRMNR